MGQGGGFPGTGPGAVGELLPYRWAPLKPTTLES